MKKENLRLPSVSSKPHEINDGDLESSSESLPSPTICHLSKNKGITMHYIDTWTGDLSNLIPPPNPLLNKPVPLDDSLMRTFKMNSSIASYIKLQI